MGPPPGGVPIQPIRTQMQLPGREPMEWRRMRSSIVVNELAERVGGRQSKGKKNGWGVARGRLGGGMRKCWWTENDAKRRKEGAE